MEEAPTLRTGIASSTRVRVLKALLLCGILAPMVYIGTDIYLSSIYPGYSYSAQQVSELSAVGAPTAPFWNAMSRVYGLLAIAFGVGIWLSAGRKRSLRVAGILLVIGTVIGQLWPPMNQRGSLGSLNDILHVVFAGVVVLTLVLVIAFGSGARGKGFRAYSIATIVAMLAAGMVIFLVAAPAMAAGQPTPGMGIVERVSVYGPMVWFAALSIALLTARRPEQAGEHGSKPTPIVATPRGAHS